MTRVILLRDAQEDLRSTAAFYEDESRGLGGDFLREVTRAFGRLSENPGLGAPVGKGSRKLVLRRFPYLVIYRIEEGQVLVLAVAPGRLKRLLVRGLLRCEKVGDVLVAAHDPHDLK